MLKAYSPVMFMFGSKQCEEYPNTLQTKKFEDEQGPYVETRDIFKQLFLATIMVREYIG